MFCSNCGKELDNDDKCCKHCGYQIAKEEVSKNINYTKNQMSEAHCRKNITNGVATIICTIILFCFAFDL